MFKWYQKRRPLRRSLPLQDMCGAEFARELRFWGISPAELHECCWEEFNRAAAPEGGAAPPTPPNTSPALTVLRNLHPSCLSKVRASQGFAHSHRFSEKKSCSRWKMKQCKFSDVHAFYGCIAHTVELQSGLIDAWLERLLSSGV